MNNTKLDDISWLLGGTEEEKWKMAWERRIDFVIYEHKTQKNKVKISSVEEDSGY